MMMLWLVLVWWMKAAVLGEMEANAPVGLRLVAAVVRASGSGSLSNFRLRNDA
jgi:hypothetical protein